MSLQSSFFWGTFFTAPLSQNIHLNIETLRNHRRQHLAHNDANRDSIIYDFDETEKAFYEIVDIFNNLCDPDIDVRVNPISDDEIQELKQKIIDGLNELLKDAAEWTEKEDQKMGDSLKLREIEKRSDKAALDFPSLFHYTTMDAFQNMLFSSHEFWFTKASYCNDSTELLDFIDNLKTAVLQVVQPQNVERCTLFFDKVYASAKENYPYIFCLSTKRDDAAQWERYAGDATGVCIKMNTKLFSKLLFYLDGGTILQRVYYDYDARKHEHCGYVKDWIDNGIPFGSSKEPGFISNIVATAPSYKHWSFESEAEVRAIAFFLYRIMDSEITSKGKKKVVRKVNFFEPCNELGIDVQDLFDEIIIGPKCEKSIGIIKEEFRAKGFEKLAERIKVSECPLQ